MIKLSVIEICFASPIVKMAAGHLQVKFCLMTSTIYMPSCICKDKNIYSYPLF